MGTGSLRVKRAEKPDNTGGYDWAILDDNNKVVGEAFEHVGWENESTGCFDKRDAEENARLWASAPDLLALLTEFTDHYSGNKQGQLGNGFAYKWCDRARELIQQATQPAPARE